jgi:hypothetical protein
MKTSSIQSTAFEKCLHAGCVLAITALAVGMFVYVKIDRGIKVSERETQVTENLIEAEQFRNLIREINNGQTNNATYFLKSRLAYDMSTVDTLPASEGEQQREFAAHMDRRIASDKKSHPEYYMASARLPKALRTDVAQH